MQMRRCRRTIELRQSCSSLACAVPPVRPRASHTQRDSRLRNSDGHDLAATNASTRSRYVQNISIIFCRPKHCRSSSHNISGARSTSNEFLGTIEEDLFNRVTASARHKSCVVDKRKVITRIPPNERFIWTCRHSCSGIYLHSTEEFLSRVRVIHVPVAILHPFAPSERPPEEELVGGAMVVS